MTTTDQARELCRKQDEARAERIAAKVEADVKAARDKACGQSSLAEMAGAAEGEYMSRLYDLYGQLEDASGVKSE
jgi:hypothetical protein